jgi:thiol:disulfide interchange protein DsbA
MKDIMRFLRLLIAAVTLMVSTSGAFAAEPNAAGYTTLDTPRVDLGKKIEVVEFFMYSCPHCYALEPLMAEWVKKQGDNIVFRRVHLAFGGPNDPQPKAYTTLEAMGKLDLVHEKMFRAIHVERQRLNKDDAIVELLVKSGIDKAKYLEFSNSFAVQTKMKRNLQLIAAYKIDSAPTIVIDGRYLTSPSILSRPGQSERQTQEATLRVMDSLVAKVQQETGKTAAKK